MTSLGGAKIRLVYADHQGDPQKGRAEAERLITQEKVSAIVGTYQSAVAVTVSQTCERYQIPFVSADNSSPSLHTPRPEILLPRGTPLTKCSRRRCSTSTTR